jgi:hypothetical protein
MTHKTHKMNRNDMNQEWPNAHTWILFSAPQPLLLGYRVRPDLRSTAQEPPRRPPK